MNRMIPYTVPKREQHEIKDTALALIISFVGEQFQWSHLVCLEAGNTE